MVLFEGTIWPISLIYIKTAGSREIVSLPVSEALDMLVNVEYDHNASIDKSNETGEETFVFKGEVRQLDGKTLVGKICNVPKKELIEFIQASIYNNKTKVTDVAVQPKDEMLTREMQTFIGI
jgi:hypothetical protein